MWTETAFGAPRLRAVRMVLQPHVRKLEPVVSWAGDLKLFVLAGRLRLFISHCNFMVLRIYPATFSCLGAVAANTNWIQAKC